MNRYRYELEPEAQDDLERLYDFLLQSASIDTAEAAFKRIYESLGTLEIVPHSCRKAISDEGKVLRELIINFGSSGYVALFEIRSDELVSVLAIKHQREDDYH
jgi:plasmid stabilization system protein ParE